MWCNILQQHVVYFNPHCNVFLHFACVYVCVSVCLREYANIAVCSLTCHTATGIHMPYSITQCYLPPDRGDIPAFTPAKVRLSDPGGMQGWVDLVGLRYVYVHVCVRERYVYVRVCVCLSHDSCSTVFYWLCLVRPPAPEASRPLMSCWTWLLTSWANCRRTTTWKRSVYFFFHSVWFALCSPPRQSVGCAFSLLHVFRTLSSFIITILFHCFFSIFGCF